MLDIAVPIPSEVVSETLPIGAYSGMLSDDLRGRVGHHETVT